MQVVKIITSPIGTNTYILVDQKDALVIDPGMYTDRLKEKLAELGAVCSRVVLTHGHYDHASAAAALQDDGAKICVHADDVPLNSPAGSLAAYFALPYTPYRPNVLLCDGDNLSFGGVQFRVLHTPGHTGGGICLIGGDVIFSGDTLFFESVGRTDFPNGSASALKRSIDKLLRLEGDYTVYPGHGDSTTLAHERQFNPWAE